MSIENQLINENIKSKEVQVINELGENLGIFNISDALNLAYSKNLDLVLVNDGVCKILDYKKSLYESKKRSRANKEKSFKTKWKEIQLNINIGENDIKVKSLQVSNFINKGYKIKVVILLKGREISKPHLSLELIEKFKSFITVDFKVTKEPSLDGNRLVFHLE